MSAVEKIKAAAAELDPDEQYELFRWWVESDSFKQRQLAALKHDIAIGVEQLDNGRYRTYDDAIRVVFENDYVLVRAEDRQVCGIITASDLTEQFQKLAEPFLLVGEIENGVRRLLHGRFTKEELEAAKNAEDKERKVESVADLTFGEYIRLLEPERNWAKLELEVDRAEFLKGLHEIREIRNDVMHFDPDGLDEGDLMNLRKFAQFLKRLRNVGAA